MSEKSPCVSQTIKVDEFYELNVADDVEQSPPYNEDIAPTKISQRT